MYIYIHIYIHSIAVAFVITPSCTTLIPLRIKRSTGDTHTHAPTENNTPDADTRSRQEQHSIPPNKHLPHTLDNARRWRDDGACPPRVNPVEANSPEEKQQHQWNETRRYIYM